MTRSRDSASISAYARLLMSSEVQAKWMNSSERCTSRFSASRSRNQYSIALTSWLVSASIRLMRSLSCALKPVSRPASAARAALDSGGSSRIAGAAARACSHCSSTRTR